MKALADAGYMLGIVYCGGQGSDQGTRALVYNLYGTQFTNAEHTEYTIGSEAGIKGLTLLQTLVEYRRILLEVAEHYGLPVLDLYAVSGMQPKHAVCRERLMPDGLHPSDEGHAILAQKLGNFLKTI